MKGGVGGDQPVLGSISLWRGAHSEVQAVIQKQCCREGLFAKSVSSHFASGWDAAPVPTESPTPSSTWLRAVAGGVRGAGVGGGAQCFRVCSLSTRKPLQAALSTGRASPPSQSPHQSRR